MSITARDVIKGIDWELLREQKQGLVSYVHSDVPLRSCHADGVIALIDALQDAAIEDRTGNGT